MPAPGRWARWRPPAGRRSAAGQSLGRARWPRLLDGEDASRIVDRHLGDLPLRDGSRSQGWQEVLLEIGVAEPAVGPQLDVVADILADQQLWPVATLQQLDDQLHQPRLGCLLGAEALPDEVELQVGP